MPEPTAAKPITEHKIPGTDIPDITKAEPGASDREKRWMSRVAVTTAVLATLASLATMFAGNHLSAAMFEQIKGSDQWNYFQAKSLKLAIAESKIEMLPAMGKSASPEDAAKVERYQQEQKTIEGIARTHEAAANDHLRRQKQLSNASTALQIGIALSAVALLTKKNLLWALSIGAGLVGVVFFAFGLLGGAS